MANSLNQASAAFRAHLETLVRSTSAGALCDTDEEAIRILERKYAQHGQHTFTDQDVENYLQSQWQDLEDNMHVKADDEDDQAEEPEVLRWLRQTLPSSANYESVAALLDSPGRTDDEIVSDLLDLIGFDHIDLLPTLISRRAEVKAAVASQSSGLADKLNHLSLGGTPTLQTPIESDSDARETFFDGNRNAQGRKQRGKQRKDGKPKELKFALHAGMSIEELEQRHLEKLEEAAARPLVSNKDGYVHQEAVRYPHVYANHAAAEAASAFGSKLLLPVGTTKTEYDHYSETSIPTPAKHPSAYTAKLLPISTLPDLVRRSFPYKELNRLQSLVYPTAYGTTENMLVCAPTGAGKTDVAVLTVLRAISMYADVRLTDGKMRNKEWKVVYVAPMKALASEIVGKMKKRFSWCGLAVRELTGDMQLTRQEIAETQMIVTTPEKWDVVTRKTTGEGELASRLRLLIIDEVHLLHEDRGAVLESIVARTLRQVESSQTLIRIVGLSATLPNYVDVADFLRVNPYNGMFFFDSSFRPVPLEQHFIAAKGKAGSQTSKDNLDHATFDKALNLIKDGHQVLIFVHARKDTVKTAQMIKEKAIAEGEMDLFNGKDDPKYENFRRELNMSRNREMKELVDVGIGIHHAGMLRTDRNLSERLFEQNVTKILVCTATLAWGVNLPAYAVIIKGTQLYDSSKGAFMDLSVLDVLQMFGRAGRPQYETHGVSYICTTSDKVDHYITAISQQVPIESKFIEGLVDSLNAEISLGTVSTVDEGVRWLGYTFLHVRMRKNPLVYGLSSADLFNDPALGTRRRELIIKAAKILERNGMIQYDEATGQLVSNELGQIASRYYLRSASVETFNSLFRPTMTEADLLALLAKSSEFQQVAVRESEAEELKNLVENVIPCQVKGGTDTSDGKANVLLQAHICRAALQDFALISDMGYVAQNAGRIARSLQDIAMSRKWSQTTASLLSICKAVESEYCSLASTTLVEFMCISERLWPWCHPLEQMSLSGDLIYNIKQWADDLTIEELVEMSASEIGKLIRMNERLGEVALTAAKQFPRLDITPKLQPLSSDLLRVVCEVTPAFTWNDKLHHRTEWFWIWLSDAEDQEILQITKVSVKPNTTTIRVDFNIALADKPEMLNVRMMSDTWLGSESTISVPLNDLILPPQPPAKRKILDLPFQENQVDPRLAELLRTRMGLQSAFEMQCLHSLFFSQANILIAAPVSKSRDQLITVPIWRLIKTREQSITLVLAPGNAQARQLHKYLSDDLSFAVKKYNIDVRLATRQTVFDGIAGSARNIGAHTIIISTARAIQRLIGHDNDSIICSANLVIACDLHNLSAEYEFALSCIDRSSSASPRIVGCSAPLLDATSLADWLHVNRVHLYSFNASARPYPVITSFTTFNLPSSPGMLKAMIKPAYEAMRSNLGSTICFVPHRSQCYTALADFLTASATDMNKLVEMDEELLAQYAMRISDPKIAEGIEHGFAIYNESMSPADQVLVRHLFNTHAIRALIASRDSCHSLEMTASLVIVMSTQYASYDRGTDERHVLDYPMDDLLQMQAIPAEHQEQNPADNAAVAQCMIFTQPDKASLISKLMNEGLPLESSLLGSEMLLHAILSRLADRTIATKQKCLDAICTTFLSERLQVNPYYYGRDALIRKGKPETKNERLSSLVDDILESMRTRLLLRFDNEDSTTMQITPFGKAVSQNRITQVQVDTLFEMKEASAMKICRNSENVQKTVKKVSMVELQTFVKRLPRSIQRKVLPPDLKEITTDIKDAKDTKATDDKVDKADAPDSETGVDIGKALLLTFLSRKLPPAGSKLEIAQARVAVALLEELANTNLVKTKSASRSS